MAWYDDFPTSNGGYGSWFDTFPGAGPAAEPTLGGNYGLSDLYSIASSPLAAQLYNLPGYTTPASTTPFTAPWASSALPLGTSSFGGLPPLSLGSFGTSGLGQGYGQLPGYSPPSFGSSQMRGRVGSYGAGQQSLGGLPQQMPGYGGPTGFGGPQGYAQSAYGQQAGYAGGTSNPANIGGAAGAGLPLPPGGVYGAQKWSSPMGSNAVDIFVPRGTPVTAPVSGTLQQGANGQLILVGDNGLSFAFRHGMTTAQGHVQQGQQIGIVNDPSLDMLGNAPWGQMPDKYQHLELSVSRGNYFPATPGGGGNIDAAQWLESQGYRGRKIGKTPGPPDAQGGMGMGGPFGGMGGGMGMGMGGAGGFPGMMPGMMGPGMGFGGPPGLGGMPFGGGPMGFGGMSGGFNPMMGMFGGGFGGF